MPDAAITGLINQYGIWGVVAAICLLGAQAFYGARGKNSAYPERDEKHDSNQGQLREIKTMIEASERNRDRERTLDRERIEQMFEKIEDKFDRVIQDQVKVMTIVEGLRK